MEVHMSTRTARLKCLEQRYERIHQLDQEIESLLAQLPTDDVGCILHDFETENYGEITWPRNNTRKE
jgi:hypothetical protein